MALFTARRLLASLLVAALPTSALANYTINCESNGNRYQYCNANTSGYVRIVNQMSRNACIQGRTWGYDWNGVWVSNGCRARFEVGGRDTGGGGGGGNNDAGNALAVAGGLAILGAIIANSDNNNPPSQPARPVYSNVPPWAIGSFYGQDPYSGNWQTISIDPNGGVARYVNGYPAAYGNFNNGAIYFGGQGLAVQPSGNGLAIGGSFYSRQ
jgi:hypothetical protein